MNKKLGARSNLFLATAITLALTGGSARTEEALRAACAAEGALSAGALHKEWLLSGWERTPADGPFNFRDKLGKYYLQTDGGVLLYDDFDPKHRVARSAAQYGAIWEPVFSSLRSARHRVVAGPFVTASADLAASMLVFVGRLEGSDGKITGVQTNTSTVWRCTPEGWKIIREHNSSAIIPAEDMDSAMSPISGG